MATKKYIDLEGLTAFWAKVNTHITTELAKKADTCAIPDVSAFITNAVDDLANYYLKSETYTKSEVDTIINAVKQFTYESVGTLPTASASTMNKIYLVPSSSSATQNIKDEYITIQDGSTYKWEQIGSTAVDLSGYPTKTYVDTELGKKQNTISDLATIRSGASAGATAYQKPSGGIPSNDLAQAVKDALAKANSALQASDITGKVDQSTYSADMTTINNNFSAVNNKLNDITTATVAECEKVVTG